MATLKFKFTTKGQGNFKNKITLQCSVKGSSTRHYMSVEEYLKPFNLSGWNEAKGIFYDGENMVVNNSVLSEIINDCINLAENRTFLVGKDLFDYYKDIRRAKDVPIPTFLEWLDVYIEKERTKEIGRSSNYQFYITLKHKLQGVDVKNKKSFDAPRCNGVLIGEYLITELDTVCFRTFCNWMLNEQKGKGYRNLCSIFKASLEKITEQYPGFSYKVVDTHNWRSLIPQKAKLSEVLSASQKLSAVSGTIPVLTLKEIEMIENLDLNLIKSNSNKRNLSLLELYRDYALLIYYLSSRPADVLQLHSIRNLSLEDKKIIYVPFKLRNRGGKPTIVNLNNDYAKSDILKSMNEKALLIIEKYRNQSKGGYLLPFPINEKDWGIIDGLDYYSWETHRNDTLQLVNGALKKIAETLNLSVKKLSLYTFRHSSITHIINGGENWGTVAYRAGTSVKMIEKHYYNPAKQ